MFSTIPKRTFVYLHLLCHLQNAFSLDQSEKFSFGKGSTLSQTTSLDSSKLKEFADNNFKFDENDRKLSEQVKNTVGKE